MDAEELMNTPTVYERVVRYREIRHVDISVELEDAVYARQHDGVDIATHASQRWLLTDRLMEMNRLSISIPRVSDMNDLEFEQAVRSNIRRRPMYKWTDAQMSWLTMDEIAQCLLEYKEV